MITIVKIIDGMEGAFKKDRIQNLVFHLILSLLGVIPLPLLFCLISFSKRKKGERERGRSCLCQGRKKVFFVPCSLSLSVSILGKRMEQIHAFSFVLMTYTHFFLPIFYWYFLPLKIEKNNSISLTLHLGNTEKIS